MPRPRGRHGVHFAAAVCACRRTGRAWVARPSRRSRCAARAGSTAVRAQTTTGRPEPGRRGQHLHAGLPPAACSVRPGRHTRPDRDPHDSRTRPLTKFIYARRARARSAAPLPEWHHDLIHWHSSLQSRPFVNDTPARCVCRSAGTCRVLCRYRLYAASFHAQAARKEEAASPGHPSQIVWLRNPPSTRRSIPVTKPDAQELARKIAAPMSSFSWP